MARTITYRFGRLSLLPQITGEDRYRQIREALAGPSIEAQGDYWGFFDVQELRVGTEEFLCGLLVRYEPETEEQVADEKHKAVVTEGLENVIKAKSSFYLHLAEEENLIAFHPVAGISENQFRQHFLDIYRAAHQGFFIEPHLDLITKELGIWTALEEFDKILRIRVRLHRPNPYISWDPIKEDLKKKNASEYREEYRADERSSGLELHDDEESKAKIKMAEDGYGDAQIEGFREGRPETASTNELPVTAEVARTEETHEGVIRVLLEGFRELWERFH